MATINGNKISDAQEIINGMSDKKKVKYVKGDKGLIERDKIDDSIILVEDNRQVLFG